MLKLGKKVQYALVAMFHLDRVALPGTRVTTRELSLRYGIPEQHLGKVLQRLGRAGVLTSVQGVQGGYELHRSLRDISLGDVMNAVDGVRAAKKRENHTILTVFPACYVQGLTHEVERNVVERVHEMRLSEVLNPLDISPSSPKNSLEATG